jgi:sugar fermentation stimulation protein A
LKAPPAFRFWDETATLAGVLVSRPNRFLVEVQCGRERLLAHCPNPGRMLEMLVPGCRVLLEPAANPRRKTAHTLVAAEYAGQWIPLVSVAANAAVRALVLEERFGDARVVAEYTHGRSRFDFMIEAGDARHLVEVKACTQVEHRVALFPDAPTKRGLRHLSELADADDVDGRLLIFAILNPDADVFMPNMHIDPAFSAGLLAAAGAVELQAVAIRTAADGSAVLANRAVPIDLQRVAAMPADSGTYLLTLELPQSISVVAGALGTLELRAGYYLYVGSAMRNLWHRIGRHLARPKRAHWHIDHLTQRAAKVSAAAIVSAHRLECHAAALVADAADAAVPRFGSSDCHCGSHLFYFQQHPLAVHRFRRALAQLRHHDAWQPPASVSGRGTA